MALAPLMVFTLIPLLFPFHRFHSLYWLPATNPLLCENHHFNTYLNQLLDLINPHSIPYNWIHSNFCVSHHSWSPFCTSCLPLVFCPYKININFKVSVCVPFILCHCLTMNLCQFLSFTSGHPSLKKNNVFPPLFCLNICLFIFPFSLTVLDPLFIVTY